MPYVNEETRDHLYCDLEGTGWPLMPEAKTPGELGYMLGLLLDGYFKGQKPSYARFAEAAGVLHTVLFDFLVRFLLPYEAKKLEENGEVYTFHKEEHK